MICGQLGDFFEAISSLERQKWKIAISDNLKMFNTLLWIHFYLFIFIFYCANLNSIRASYFHWLQLVTPQTVLLSLIMGRPIKPNIKYQVMLVFRFLDLHSWTPIFIHQYANLSVFYYRCHRSDRNLKQRKTRCQV